MAVRKRQQVIQRDDILGRELGKRIEADRLLPDTILVDLGPIEPLIVFVEAVATAGRSVSRVGPVRSKSSLTRPSNPVGSLS